MRDKIKSIYQKYGDLVFSLAVPHLLDCGRTNLNRMDVEKEVAKILATYPNSDNDPAPMVSTELKAEVLRCAAELAGVDTIEILKYIQTDMRFRGVNVHPGNIVFFKDRQTGKVYSDLVLNKELSVSDKDRLADKIRSKVSGNRRHPETAITETLDEMGIAWDYLYSDYEIVF